MKMSLVCLELIRPGGGQHHHQSRRDRPAEDALSAGNPDAAREAAGPGAAEAVEAAEAAEARARGPAALAGRVDPRGTADREVDRGPPGACRGRPEALIVRWASRIPSSVVRTRLSRAPSGDGGSSSGVCPRRWRGIVVRCCCCCCCCWRARLSDMWWWLL
jgi:hypothetical protein